MPANRKEFRDAAGQLLAYKLGPPYAAGLAAYSDDRDYIQVLSWNYPAGKHLQEHIHNTVPREAQRTQEAVVVLSGAVTATIYDGKRQLVAKEVISAHEVMVFLAGGHGYDITATDTVVLELKNGPYPGAEADRVRFTP